MKWGEQAIEWSWNAFGIALAGAIATVLIAFMVVTPICTLGLVSRPAIATATIVVPDARDLIVVVNREGIPYIAGEQVTTLDAALRSGRYSTLVLEVDRRARYGSLTPILRAARTAHLPVRFAAADTSLLEQAHLAR